MIYDWVYLPVVWHTEAPVYPGNLCTLPCLQETAVPKESTFLLDLQRKWQCDNNKASDREMILLNMSLSCNIEKMISQIVTNWPHEIFQNAPKAHYMSKTRDYFTLVRTSSVLALSILARKSSTLWWRPRWLPRLDSTVGRSDPHSDSLMRRWFSSTQARRSWA